MKKENFSFSMVPNVPANAEFHFHYDDKITCKRIGKSEKVRYNGGDYSLSSAAQAAYEKIFNSKASLAGPKYWLYEGKTLDAWRVENEQKKTDKDIHIEIQKMSDYFIRYYAEKDIERGNSIENLNATAIFNYVHHILAQIGFVTAEEKNGRLFLYALYPMNFIGIVDTNGHAIVWDYVQKLMKEKVGVEIAIAQFKIDDIHGIDIHEDTLGYLESTWQMYIDGAMTFEQAFMED